MTQRHDPTDETVAGLVHRLVDDGRTYVRAEIDVVKATASAKFAATKTAVVVGIAAIFVVQAGLTVLFIALGSALALLMPIWAGQLVAAVIAFALAGLMVKFAISRFSSRIATPAGEPS